MIIENANGLATAQRLAISRVRLTEEDLTEATMLDIPRSTKMGQTEHVGCMAVLERAQTATACNWYAALRHKNA